MKRILMCAIVTALASVVSAQSIRIGWPASPQATDDVFVMRYYTVANGEGYGTMPRDYVVEAKRSLGKLADVGMASWAGGTDAAYVTPGNVSLAAVEATFNTLSILRIKPALGRDFSEADVRAGRRLAILTNVAWRKYFDGRVDAIGSTLQHRGAPRGAGSAPTTEVIGILPPGVFSMAPEIDPNAEVLVLWPDLLDSPSTTERAVAPIVRLPTGVTVAQAQAVIGAAATRLQSSGVGDPRYSLRLESLRVPRR